MEHGRAKTAINLNADSEKSGPIERIRALTGADVIPGKMILLLDACVSLNITRQSQGPINPFASEISRYIVLQFPYQLLHSANKCIKTPGYGFPPMWPVSIVFTAFALRLSYPLYRFIAVIRSPPRFG